MSIEFEEQHINPTTSYQARPELIKNIYEPDSKSLVHWFVKKRIVSSEASAIKLLIIFTTIFFLVSVYVMYNTYKAPEVKTLNKIEY